MSKKKPFLSKHQIAAIMMGIGILGFAFLEIVFLRAISLIIFAIGLVAAFSE